MPEVERWADKHGFRICLTAARDGRGVPEICPFIVEILRSSRRKKEGAIVPADQWKVTPEQMISVYRIIYGENEWDRLGLTAEANGTMVAKAYRRLAAQIHPDKCPLNGSGEAFKLLTASKDMLLSPKDRLTIK
ncbi:hypothetical protein RvY_00929 [Ramazzottius varieornatus]|uniref:J domain-containing protein n=1 Tax=Ramazzottius varieornatus TaxID=947166 RepID=A0A1D1UII2_RAMVA|nr:hypothetical protein RvY_00929 [Ramazzottius varieornatus]